MRDFNAPNLPEKSSRRGSFSITKNFKSYFSQTLDTGAGPLLPLPEGFNNYTVNSTVFIGTFNGTAEIKLNCPTAKDPLTGYCNECLRTYVTIEFVKLVDQMPFPAAQPFLRDDRLEYAVSLYNTIYKLPLTTNDYNVRSTLAYYLSPPLNIFLTSDPETQAKLARLKDSLKAIEAKYNAVLIQTVLPQTVTNSQGKMLDKPLLDYFNKQRGGRILNRDEAQSFIEKITGQMKLEIDVFFAEAQIRAVMFNADPYISDPRFRMSIAEPRWNEYDETIKREVAFYNQKFAAQKFVGKNTNYVPLDWRWVKAMLWSECYAGPISKPDEWNNFPMQIGRRTDDKGYVTVRDAKPDEGADLVVEDELKQKVQNKADMVRQLNVRAGIAYLFIRAADDVGADEDKIIDAVPHTYIIKSGDKISKLIDKGIIKTTQANIIKNTAKLTEANIGDLAVGQVITYQEAEAKRKILSWKDWMTAIQNYNTKNLGTEGDPVYVDKVKRAYQIIVSRTPQ